MDSATEFVRAMGMWGWMAVIACTAIIVQGVVRMKELSVRSERPESQPSNADNV